MVSTIFSNTKIVTQKNQVCSEIISCDKQILFQFEYFKTTNIV